MSLILDSELPVGELDEQVIKRKILLISVGSSASIHLMKGIVSKRPDILFDNELMFVETSRDMLKVAVTSMTNTYKRALAWKSKKNPDSLNGQVLPNRFSANLYKRSILLGGEGGGADPDVGLTLYSKHRSEVIQHISSVVEENEITGIIVIGSAGKGTGSLITPSLVHDLIERSMYNLPFPIGILTMPFRFRKTDVQNARKSIAHIQTESVPMFLLDYEHALNMYLYLTGGAGDNIPTTQAVYSAVVEGIASVLSDLIEALNWGDRCSPPIDWSDLGPLFKVKGVGTINYSIRRNITEIRQYWQDDLRTLLLLRTKQKPEATNVATIIRSGAGIDFDFPEKVSKFYSINYNTNRHEIYTLNHGKNFTISSLMFGFDPEEIDPPLEYKKLSLGERLKGL